MTAQTVEVNGLISRKDQSQCQSPMHNGEDSSNAFNFTSRERSNSDEFNQVQNFSSRGSAAGPVGKKNTLSQLL